MTKVYKVRISNVYDEDDDVNWELLQDLINDCSLSTSIVEVQPIEIGEWDSKERPLSSQWQPISTAPENEKILVYHPSYGVSEAKYKPDYYRVDTDTTEPCFIFYECEEDYWYTVILETPLYWQPLPQPPQL